MTYPVNFELMLSANL